MATAERPSLFAWISLRVRKNQKKLGEVGSVQAVSRSLESGKSRSPTYTSTYCTNNLHPLSSFRYVVTYYLQFWESKMIFYLQGEQEAADMNEDSAYECKKAGALERDILDSRQ